jgi:hypothetical protein
MQHIELRRFNQRVVEPEKWVKAVKFSGAKAD